MSRTHGRKGPPAVMLLLAALALTVDLVRRGSFLVGVYPSFRPDPETPALGIIRSIQGRNRPRRP